MNPLTRQATAPTLAARWSVLQRRLAPYLFISPFYILFLIFGVFPILFSGVLAFASWYPVQGLQAIRLVGWENFVFVLGDPDFWKSLSNTIILFLLGGLPQHLIALPLAFLLNSGLIRARDFFTASYFAPYVTSTVAVAIIFGVMLGWHFGIVNEILKALAAIPGLRELLALVGFEPPVNWLGQREMIKPAIAIVLIWRWTGWQLVIYLAGLQTIPREYYEAAEVDGATRWQQFFHITLPLLRPIIFFATTLTIIGQFQLFDEPYIMLGPTGGVAKEGLTLTMYMYREAFHFGEYGTATATSWLVFLGILVFTLVNLRAQGRTAFERREA